MSIRKGIIAILSIIFLTSCWFSPQDKTRYLVAFDREPDIYLLNVSDGGIRNITESFFPVDYRAELCSFSHDDRYLLFSVDTFHTTYPHQHRHEADLYCYDLLTGDIDQLTHSDFENISAEFSPDDEQIVLMSSYDYRYHIFLMDRDGSNFHDLQNSIQYEYCPKFSPDGQYVYYIRYEDFLFNVCRNTLDGQNEELLTFNTDHNKDYCISSDGNILYYDGMGIVRKDLNDGSTVQLTPRDSLNFYYSTPKLSPGGQLLAYRYKIGSDYYACLMDTCGNQKQEVCEAYDFAFSPDGKYLFCYGYEDIVRYNISSGTLDILYSDSLYYFSGIAVTRIIDN